MVCGKNIPSVIKVVALDLTKYKPGLSVTAKNLAVAPAISTTAATSP